MKTFNTTINILMGMLIMFIGLSSCSKDQKDEPQPDVKAIVSQFDWYNFEPSSDPKFYQARIDRLDVPGIDNEYDVFPIDEIVNKNTIAEAQVLVYTCRIDWTVEPHPRTFHRLPHTSGAKRISVTNKSGVLMLTATSNVFTSTENYYFAVIILPKGFKMPTIDLDNFDEVAAYFKIKKDFPEMA
jgi:hypothetical protein